MAFFMAWKDLQTNGPGVFFTIAPFQETLDSRVNARNWVVTPEDLPKARRSGETQRKGGWMFIVSYHRNPRESFIFRGYN